MGSDNWCSPREIAGPLEQLYDGPTDVDPCSNPASIIKARISYFQGGLVLPWCLDDRPGTAYENDPYSQAEVWTKKMLAEIACGNVTEIVRLSMMSTSTKWWEDMCLMPARNPRILALRRLKFIEPPEEREERLAKRKPSKGAPQLMTCRFEPALTYIGPRPQAFTKAFAHLTRWATWGRG